MSRRHDVAPLRPALFAGAGLVAAWFASRPPWGEVATAVLWAGAVVIMTGIVAERRAGTVAKTGGILFALGLASGILTGWAAGNGQASGALALGILVVAGRFAAWTVLDRPEGLWAGPLALFAVAVPGLWGVWGVAAAVVEALALYGAGRIDRNAAAWPFALGGAGVVLGLGAIELGITF